jgi:hypothetical protein
MTLLADGPTRHEHTLPSLPDLRPGAVAQCPGCGRFFVLDPIPWERTWRPVRWWDRRARRVIRERASRAGLDALAEGNRVKQENGGW